GGGRTVPWAAREAGGVCTARGRHRREPVAERRGDPARRRAAHGAALKATMPRATTYSVAVTFGDCDPAGIVFFPNFSRWMDAASHHYFRACGLPPWRDMEEVPGCVGPPLLEIHTRFLNALTYGERIEIHSHVEEWRGKVFIQV